ncbi:MAG: hypothetical protein U5L05_00890 [Rubrivivax sp.]|nr:hypothetical protein [Rubrivivax sp.]
MRSTDHRDRARQATPATLVAAEHSGSHSVGPSARGLSHSPRLAAQRRWIGDVLGAASPWQTGTEGGVLRQATGALDGPVQCVRAVISPLSGAAVTLAGLEQAMAEVLREVGELGSTPAEVELGFVALDDITRWRGQYDTAIAHLRSLNPGTAAFSFDQIKARDSTLMNAFWPVVIALSNLRGALNKSLKEYDEHLASKQQQAVTYDPGEFAEKKKVGKKEVKPKVPYAVGEYVPTMGGAVVLIDKEAGYVVALEHYQLKHQAIGQLLPGGPWKGKKGSTLPGGWAEHVSTHAPAVLVEAKASIKAWLDAGNVPDDSTTVSTKKIRLDQFEGYLAISHEGGLWIITYHCNPPG